MTKEEVQEIFGKMGYLPDALDAGDKIHVTSEGNEWMDARFYSFSGGGLWFFSKNGRLTIVNTPFILTKLEEDEQDTDTDAS